MAYPAKSEEDKNMQGTARNDRQTPDFVDGILPDTLPDPPSYLTKIGRKQWKKYTKLLQNQRILSETDLDSLGRYCFLLQVAEEAAEELKQGVVREMVDDMGQVYYVKTPPLLQIFHEASSAAFKFEQQFGFTPASRKGVPAPKKQREGRLVKLMGGKRS